MKRVNSLLLKFFGVFVFMVLATTLSPSTSSAEDVWFYSQGELSYYLQTDNISKRSSKPPYTYNNYPPYSCCVKYVYNGQYDNFQIYGFANENNTIIGYSFSRSHGDWTNIGRASDDPFYNALWNALRQYI